MKIAVNRASKTEAPVWETVEGNPQAVGEILALGGEVAPVRVASGKSEQFYSADWLFVSFELPQELAAGLLAHSFTKQHAGTVWLADRSNGRAACLIGFPMEHTVTDMAGYTDLLSGLATVYGAKAPTDALSGWRTTIGGCAKGLAGSLNAVAVGRLSLLGRENKTHARHPWNGFIRSMVRLSPAEAVRTRNGSEESLVSLVEKTPVHCPVHADALGVAQVIGKNGVKAVLCPVCQRNFWALPPDRGVDFGHFRRVFGKLLAQENHHLAEGIPSKHQGTALLEIPERQFTLLRERYLPPMELQPGVTLVRSPTGTGKTQALEGLIKICKKQCVPVLLVGHRRALLVAMADRLSLDLYFEPVDGDAQDTKSREVAPTKSYAICLDSMPTRLIPHVHQFSVVVIDESEQVIQHLMGRTLKKQRQAAFLMLQHYLTEAYAVYFLDADLGKLSVSAALGSARVGTEVRFIVNEPPVEEREVDLVTTREGLMAKLVGELNAGKKCYVACNSKKRAESIGLWITRRWPDKRVEVVTSENARTERVQELLRDVASSFLPRKPSSLESGITPASPENRALDVLVASPAIGTGIDITFPDNAVGVDHVFGLFECGVNTHFDIDQQLARVRNPGRVSVWVNRNVTHYETDPGAVRRELKGTVARTDGLIGYERDGRPVYQETDRPLIELWSEIVATQRASKNNLFSNWLGLREANGWRGVTEVVADEDKERGKAALAEGKALRDAQRAGMIADAEDLDEEQAVKLTQRDNAGPALSPGERACLEKWRLGTFYATEVDEGLVAFDDEGSTRQQVLLLEIMIGDAEWNRLTDLREIGNEDKAGVIVFDRQFRTAKAKILAELLSAAGLLDAATGEFHVDAELATDTLNDFVARFKLDRKRIESELGLDMRRDIEKKPMQQVGDVLRLIGVGTVLVKKANSNGTRRRLYSLDIERLVELLEVMVRRQEKREGRRAQIDAPESDEWDNAARVNDYKDGAELSRERDASKSSALAELSKFTLNI